jgi:hypothetical protein
MWFTSLQIFLFAFFTSVLQLAAGNGVMPNDTREWSLRYVLGRVGKSLSAVMLIKGLLLFVRKVLCCRPKYDRLNNIP